MTPLAPLAKLLIIGGLAMAGFGVLLLLLGNIPGFGRLPGDIHIQGKNSSFYFPVVTCLVLSVLLTIILNLFFRGR